MAMKGDLGDMMKQAQKMQEKVRDVQEEISRTIVAGESGAGMVKVEMTGRYDVRRVTLDPDLMKEDKELLEDLLAAAVNDAVRKVERNQQQKMSDLTAGMGIPAGMKFPFQ